MHVVLVLWCVVLVDVFCHINHGFCFVFIFFNFHPCSIIVLIILDYKRAFHSGNMFDAKTFPRLTSPTALVMRAFQAACCASHVTRHTSHVTRHTSHVKPHASNLTRHASQAIFYMTGVMQTPWPLSKLLQITSKAATAASTASWLFSDQLLMEAHSSARLVSGGGGADDHHHNSNR